jgi:hypothetical protein
VEEELKLILKHTREAKRIKPMCPIHAAVALQHLSNLQQSLVALQKQLEDGIESNKH